MAPIMLWHGSPSDTRDGLQHFPFSEPSLAQLSRCPSGARGAVQDAMVADPQPQPWISSLQCLYVKIRRPGVESNEAITDTLNGAPRQPPEIGLGSTAKPDCHPVGSSGA